MHQMRKSNASENTNDIEIYTNMQLHSPYMASEKLFEYILGEKRISVAMASNQIFGYLCDLCRGLCNEHVCKDTSSTPFWLFTIHNSSPTGIICFPSL